MLEKWLFSDTCFHRNNCPDQKSRLQRLFFLQGIFHIYTSSCICLFYFIPPIKAIVIRSGTLVCLIFLLFVERADFLNQKRRIRLIIYPNIQKCNLRKEKKGVVPIGLNGEKVKRYTVEQRSKTQIFIDT